MNAIEIKNLRYRYPATQAVVLDIPELTIQYGEFCCLVGLNGAGKTSLCRVLAGLIPHYYNGELEGGIKVCDLETKDYSISDLAGKVGFIMDDPFDQLTRATYSVREEIAFGLQNVGMPIDQILLRIDQVLADLNILQLADRLPTNLSGGEQQRVAIASIFSRDPDILVMDEATSQLDPQGADSIVQTVMTLKAKGKTILMVEPNLDLILHCADTLLVMENGKVLKYGAVTEVLNSGVFSAIQMPLPSLPALAERLVKAGRYTGNLPVNLTEAESMLKEVLHGSN